MDSLKSLLLKKSFLLILISNVVLSGAYSQRPNIIYIMTDDMGYGDLSIYGRSDYKTPNLDKLASLGIRFMNAYSAGPLCTPTRVSFMTGRYPARTPVGLYEPLTPKDSLIGLSPDHTSIASLVKKSGYTTHLVGKWHLGFSPEMSPVNNGFDEFFGFKSGATDYISHTNPAGQPDLYDNDKAITREGYMTRLLMEKTLEIIRRPHQKPFFISLMFNAPHWPWQAPGDSVYPLGRAKWQEGGSPETYAAMMKEVDNAVGQIIVTLDEAGMSNNTVIIFTSDNGGEKFSNMGIFQKSKTQLWEGGIRTAAFMCWPGKIPANKVTSQVAITMDWMATILALANAKADPAFPLDGIDLLPVCMLKSPAKKRTLFWRVFQQNQQKAIRDGDWKYLKDEKGEYLFNLEKDPGEKTNLKDAEKKNFERLKQKFADWEKTVLQPISL